MQYIQAIQDQGGEIYEVGGTVRDEILGQAHKDQDLLVRKIPFSALKKLLKGFGQVYEVGKSFGVLKFRPQGQEHDIDIALPRLEKSTGQGHKDFEVQFDENLPLELDLQRRDFTLNAMAKNLATGEIIDPFGGKQDLANRVLKQVFAQSFEEDPLRLLRAIQFAARFNLRLEEQTYQSLEAHAHLIKSVSPERIIEEVGKLFRAQKPSVGFYLMKDSGLLQHVFPELQRTIGVEQPNKKARDVFDHTMMVLDASRNSQDLDRPGDLEIMFASLFHDVGKPDTKGWDPKAKRITFYGHQVVSTRMARKWMKHYKANMLGIDPENVQSLVFNHMFETKSFYSDKAIRRFIYKMGQDLIFKLLDLRIADKKGGAFPDKFKGVLNLKKRIIDEINRKPPFGPKDLALNGHDLMKAGYPEGPVLGKIFQALVELVLDDPSLNTRESLFKYLQDHFDPKALSAESNGVSKKNSQSQESRAP